MDKRTEILKTLIENSGLNVKAFSEKANLPYSTLRSILERGVSKTSIDNMIKICDALDIKVEDLQEMAKLSESNPDFNVPEEYTKKYKVTARDKAQYIEFMKKETEAFFMDDKFDDEDKKEILDTMNEIFWKAKTLNKRKPKDK